MPHEAKQNGFQGTVGNLPLADLLQVWALNRFSGLVTVQFEGLAGDLYFVEGDVVHAEADGLTGEAAALAIFAWPEGQFDLAPNTTTLKRTIHKKLSHLLLDAHRQIDENRRPASTSPARPPVAPQGKEPSRPGVLDQIRAIRGVTYLVRFGDDGRPIGGGGPEAESLAASGLYLALTHAAAVAATFGFRELAVATLDSGRRSFVLVRGSAGFLCIAVEPGAALDPIVAQLRSILSRPAPRS
jgi:hypothetical protein